MYSFFRGILNTLAFQVKQTVFISLSVAMVLMPT
jgi:hypothetical protein